MYIQFCLGDACKYCPNGSKSTVNYIFHLEYTEVEKQ